MPFRDETFAVALRGQSPLAKEQLTNAGSIAEITSDRDVEGSMGKLEGIRYKLAGNRGHDAEGRR